METFLKPLIPATVVGVFMYIMRNSDNSPILNFVLLYILLTLVSWLFQKIEDKVKKENQAD